MALSGEALCTGLFHLEGGEEAGDGDGEQSFSTASPRGTWGAGASSFRVSVPRAGGQACGENRMVPAPRRCCVQRELLFPVSFLPWHFQFPSQDPLPVICFAFTLELIPWDHLAQTLRAALPNGLSLRRWS